MNEKVKQALENLKIIRFYVGACSEEVCKYFEQVKETLTDFDKYHESQQDLIKGKDEYIAKLCCDRAELKEENKILKEELNDLREFAKEIAKIPYLFDRLWLKDTNYKIRNSKYNENERCWLYQDVCYSTDDKNGWFLNERDGAMCFSKESAEETIGRFKQWGFEGAEDLIIVLEYKEAHDRYVLFKKVVEKYGKIN